MKAPGRTRGGAPVIERAPVAAAAALQSAGYLLAVGDSWFDYPIHDVRPGYDIHGLIQSSATQLASTFICVNRKAGG